MKKINLNQLLMSWNEKQSPQRFGRYAAILVLLLTLGVGQMWANTYYYSGQGNGTNWSKEAMTVSDDGFYEYYYVSTTTTHQFKIGTSSNQYAYNYTYVQSGFNSTDVTQIGNYSSNNCYCWKGSAHYILVYYPNTIINTSSNPKICASTTTPEQTSLKIKHSWDGSSWTWQTMSRTGSATYTYTGNCYTANGANVWTSTSDQNYLSPSGTSGVNNGVPAVWTYNSTANTLSVAPAYTLTVNAGSNGSASGSISKGIKMSTKYAISATANTGYHFNGWSRVSGGTCTFDNASSASTNVTVTGNASATVRANFAANTYTITLDGNGGSDGSATATYNSSTLTSVTHSARASYDLNGYYTATSGGTKVVNADGSLVASAGSYTNASSQWVYDDDATLHAQWTYNPVTYLLKFGKHYGSEAECTVTAKDGEDNPLTTNTSYVSGTSVTVTATCDDEDYKLGGWYNAWSGGSLIDAAGTTNPYTFTLSAATSIYAHYVQKTTSITLNKGIGSGGTAGPVTATHGNTTLSTNPLVCPAKTGYTFTGYWTASSGGVKVIDTDGTLVASVSGYTKSGNKKWDYDDPTLTLYAQYTENMTAVTLAASPVGSGTFTIGGVAATSTTAGKTTTRSVTAVPANGNYCSGTIWSKSNDNITLSSTTTNPTTVTGCGTASTSSTLTATFKPKWYLKGGFNSWETTHPFVFTTATSGYVDVELDANSNFKLYDEQSDQWYGSEYGIKKGVRLSTELWSDNGNNCPITINGLAGTYRFTLDISSGKVVTVTPPTFNQIRFYSARVDGDLTNTYDFENTGSSTWTKSVNLTAGTTYWFKVLEDGTYLGNDGTMTRANCTNWTMSAANNCGITADVTGSYTFSYVPGSDKLSVTYPTAYTITYGAGTTNGSDAAITVSPSFTSGAYVLPETDVTFSKGNTKDGYTWKGWYSNSNGSGTLHSNTDANYTWSATRTGNISVYACYTLNNYTITYNLNGGSNPVSPAPATSFTIESAAITLPTPTKTGYTFDGWYENADLSTGGVKTTIPAGSTGNKVYYAKWTPITYTIHFNGNGNTSGSMSDQTGVTYDAATTITANAFGKTGYNFAGWATTQESANAGTVDRTDGAAHGNLASTQGATAQLWAVWTAKQSTLSFDYQTSATGYGTSGSVTAASKATYNAAMPALSGSMPTAANGYAFMGFYSATGGGGTKYYNSDGTSANNWAENTESTTTLYAYYKKAEITGVTVSPSTQDPRGTVTATPTISPSPSGETIVCWRLLYSNGNIYPGITFTPGVGNSVTFTAPAASGTYKVATILRTGDACNSGTVLDSVVNTLIVAGSHTVSVQYKDASGNTIQASGSVTGTPTAWSTGITAPTITGYTFHHWLAGDGVTLSENGTSAKTGERADSSVVSPIYIQAIYEGTLTAVYTKKRMIYFYNTLNWGSVYVYFYKNDSYWQTVSPYNGSGANTSYTWTSTPYSEGLHGQMLPISEESNIYYFDAEAAGVNASYDDVVFTEHQQHGYDYFYETNAVRRGDYKSSMPMFVPLTGQTADVHNKTNYYNNGYWMNYPENTGYTLKIYNNAYATKETEAVQSIAFPYSEDLKMPIKMDVELTDGSNHDYWFMVYRNDGVYLGGGYHFKQGYQAEQVITGGNSKEKITTSAPGNYTFILTYHGDDSNPINYNFYIDVDFPIATGDYRIYYSDNATWSKAAHTKDSWCHPSHSIGKATTEAKKDTISFFIPKGVGISHTMKFQKASVTNEGVVTWADVAGGGITIPSSVNATGVYNFIVSQPAGGASISLEKVEPYTGKYYIRTDCAGNTKWDGFKNIDHEMTYSDYAEAYSGYTHYYAHWVESGTNVKFTIANDYSMCVSDTLIEDYGTTIANISNVGALNSGNASIRFMWDQATNKISRAYISGSAIVSDRFLVLEGDARMYDENGAALNIDGLSANEANLIDDQNFVYERTIKVNASARAKLTAKYNNNVQYFKGSAGDFADGTTIQLLGGTYSADKKYPMRIVYDFKTNRLVTAYMPEGEIDEEIAINADIMLIREHQEAGEQIKFTEDGALSDVKTVYGVMRFNRWTLNNKSKTGGHSALPVGDQKSFIERSLYWISFPFDVNLGDVFGFGTYGTHWILMDYDGAERAKTGYWADNEDGFWKYIWDRRGVTLKAGRGYVLALELDLMKQDNTSFWSNNIEQVELFFPSAENVNNISQTDVNVTVPAHLYDKDAHPTHTDDRTIADSHWNIIGVPSYANYDDELTDGTSTITWRTNNLPFLYEWNPTDNTYTPQSGTTYPFKAMHAYYVQYEGTLHWTLASATPSPVAARRSNKPQSVEMRLELQQNNKMIDQTFVKLSDDEQTSAGFSFGEDLSKEFNATRANIYSLISTTPAAGNTLPMSDAITYVPVGVTVPSAGEYTFAMPAGTSGVGVKLYDNLMSTYTDLSAGFTYTTDLDAGTHDGRFVLEISPIKQVTTGVEEGSDVSGQNGARKVMIDGILYIVKDNKLFDARGVRIE